MNKDPYQTLVMIMSIKRVKKQKKTRRNTRSIHLGMYIEKQYSTGDQIKKEL